LRLDHSSAEDSSEATGNPVGESGRPRAPSPALAWAITIGEATLWGTLAWLFADYWLMLPVRYRWGGTLILASLAAIGLIRLVRFYRRLRKSGLEPRTSEPRSN
jgi:hypothetical protein